MDRQNQWRAVAALLLAVFRTPRPLPLGFRRALSKAWQMRRDLIAARGRVTKISFFIHNFICAVPFCQGVPLVAKAQKPKDYSETPATLGEHLKKRRRELGLLQREAAVQMGVSAETVANWEKDKTKPVPSQFKRVIAFLGQDPSPGPKTFTERVEAKQRSLGASLAQIARYLGWDPGSLRRYLDGTWRISSIRQDALEAFLNTEDAVLSGVRSLKRRR